MESDHHPMEVKIGSESGRSGGKGEGREKWRGVWNQEGCERFRQKVGH